MTCSFFCGECNAVDQDVGPLYHCDYCDKALCYDCRPRRKHVCEEE